MKVNKTKSVVVLGCLLVLAALVTLPGAAVAKEIPKGLVIGYNVSLLANGYHQADSTWAIKYAKEKYGAIVKVFDGKLDNAVIAANVDQQVAQGIDMMSLQPMEAESVAEGVKQARKEGMIVAAFYIPIRKPPIPCVTISEKGAAFKMGVVAATKWKEFYPDKPIIWGIIGYLENETVDNERTNPFIEGILSVAPDAKEAMRLGPAGGREEAYKAAQDMFQAHPEINIVYGESVDYSLGTLAALQEMGRGKAVNGKPLTEIVVGTDAPEAELKQVFDPSVSLKVTMGLTPKDNAMARIDNLMDIYTGKVDPDKFILILTEDKQIDYWSADVKEVEAWLKDQYMVEAKLK